MIVGLAWLAVASAECVGAPVSGARFTTRLEAAEGAVARADLDALALDLAEIDLSVPCLSEAVTVDQAARLHLVTAINADPLGAQASDPAVTSGLLRYRDLRPGPLPEFVPADHGVRRAFEGLPSDPPVLRKAPVPRVGELRFDGVETREHPLDRPTLFQIVDADRVRVSAHLMPGEPLPDYAAVPRTRNALWIGAGGVAVASAAAFGGAWAVRSQYEAADDADKVERLARTTNALVLSSGVLAAGAVALGVTGFAVGPR